MSPINPSAFPPAFTPGNASFASDLLPEEGFASAGTIPWSGSDKIQSVPWPALPPPGGLPGESPALPEGTWTFNRLIGAFMSAISQLFGQAGAMFGAAPAASPAGSESRYTRASSSSVGDPHDSFHGTTAAGAPVDSAWDDMQSHANLLSSDSFDGGFRVSTSVTAPGDRGVTLNQSASVATDGGATSVSMNADGSYAVDSGGRSLALRTGVATSLGHGETVTLREDGALSVRDVDGAGGSIETILRSNGHGGVDVRTEAVNVDLGGYLTDKRDDDVDPVANAGPGPGSGLGSGWVPLDFGGRSPVFTTLAGTPDRTDPTYDSTYAPLGEAGWNTATSS